MILGLLESFEGKILIDSEELGPHNFSNWQNSIAYVPQKIYLSDDSILKNVAFGCDEQEIDRRKVEHCIQMAHLDEKVSHLEQGLDTVIGERGTKLSGGQIQRLGIARALYREPDLLILDEATSALDSVSEQIVTDAIRELSSKLTLVVIAHRMNTIKFCNMIYEIEDGKLLRISTNSDALSQG